MGVSGRSAASPFVCAGSESPHPVVAVVDTSVGAGSPFLADDAAAATSAHPPGFEPQVGAVAGAV